MTASTRSHDNARSDHDQEADSAEAFRMFKKLVNMTANQIEGWLDTEDSKEVGQKTGKNESIGHQSGRKIIKILRKNKADLVADDYAHMHKVISYIKRHLAQKPAEVEHSHWRYSLMNWGHDPLK